LNSGGLITRTVLGIEDDNTDKGFYHDPSGCCATGMVANGDADGEGDLYTLVVGGISLKFTFDRNKTVIQMPKSDYRIVPQLGSDYFKGFTVTSPLGMTYYFGYHPTTNQDAKEYTEVNDIEQLTSWFLTRIRF